MHAPHTKCKKCVTFQSVHTQCAIYSNSVFLQSVSCNRQMFSFFSFLKYALLNYAYNLHTTCSSLALLVLSLSCALTFVHLMLFFVLFTIYISRSLPLALMRASSLSHFLPLFVFCLFFSLLFFIFFFLFFRRPYLSPPHYLTQRLAFLNDPK